MLAVDYGENTYNSLFLSYPNQMKKKDEITPFNIKQNLNDYTLKKLIKLANSLIAFLCKLTIEKDLLKENVKNLEYEKMA